MLWFIAGFELLLAGAAPPVSASAAAAQDVLPLIVIDPGHGGVQEGATGICGTKEKAVALGVSLELAKLLNASGHARVELTRSDDSKLELEARPAFANARQAALFISVHANASPSQRFRGVETYFLTRSAADKHLRGLLTRENEGREQEQRADADPLAAVLSQMRGNAAHRHSQRLAVDLQAVMERQLGDYGRGVLQAPFAVLRNATMPAALVEVGFLSNPDECKQLATQAYQRQVAQTLTAAIVTYLRTAPRPSPLPQHAALRP